MLANGDEEKAFLLMTTAFQSENALMSRKTAEIFCRCLKLNDYHRHKNGENNGENFRFS
jgi:hypothetical protein